MRLPIYLDYSATTPVDPRVGQKMIPYLTEHFGNPASRSHAFGWKAEEAVEEARAHVAALIGADPKEIVWTSGATEGNNLAIKGAANFNKAKGKHIITQKTEHKAVLDTVRELERHGFEATYLEVEENGIVSVDPVRVEQALLALVDNAVKYGPKDQRVALRSDCSGGELRVEVENQGPGIPDTELPLVFERFYRLAGVEQPGSGLGLSIAQTIAEAHGGRIEAESQPGEGTRMSFVLPLLQDESQVH
jgi:signal transduction histidine kinase